MTRLVVLLVVLGISPIELQGPGTMEPQPSPQAARPVAGSGIVPRLFLPFTPIRQTISHFGTLNVGATLPSDAQCAAAIRPTPENKRMNVTFNATRGTQHLGSNFFTSSDPRANTQIAARVTGNFVGTTDEIIQWVACKWGIDEDLVRAQDALESWWRQTNLGNWTTNAARCAPGHPLGADGKPGECPGSWGALQVNYYYYSSAWPSVALSTAFNLDTAYAVWRACFEGYEWWLNDVTHVGLYVAGDVWGCMGRWNTGKWHTPEAETYISDVQSRLATRFWEQPIFQEP